jgi:hypothetical protein
VLLHQHQLGNCAPELRRIAGVDARHGRIHEALQHLLAQPVPHEVATEPAGSRRARATLGERAHQPAGRAAATRKLGERQRTRRPRRRRSAWRWPCAASGDRPIGERRDVPAASSSALRLGAACYASSSARLVQQAAGARCGVQHEQLRAAPRVAAA